MLHAGDGLARAHDFWVEDAVKGTLLHQCAHVLALNLRLRQPSKLFIHAVDAQAGAGGVADEHPVWQGVQEAFHIFCQQFLRMVGHTYRPEWKGQ